MPETVGDSTSLSGVTAAVLLGGNVHAQDELQRRLMVSTAMAGYWCTTRRYSGTFTVEVWRGIARLLDVTRGDIEDEKNVQVTNRVL